MIAVTINDRKAMRVRFMVIPYSGDSGSMVPLLIPCLAYGCFPVHRPSEGFSPSRFAGGSIGGGRSRAVAGLWRPAP
ncbi:hypothetical protein EMIT043CA1_60220 [Pseudomonas brassicacearum]